MWVGVGSQFIYSDVVLFIYNLFVGLFPFFISFCFFFLSLGEERKGGRGTGVRRQGRMGQDVLTEERGFREKKKK